MYVVWLIHISEITALSATHLQHLQHILVGASEKVKKQLSVWLNKTFNQNCYFHFAETALFGQKCNFHSAHTTFSTKNAIFILLKYNFQSKKQFWSWRNIIFNSNLRSNFKMCLPQILFSSDDNCIFITVNGQYFRRPQVLASIFSPAKHIFLLPNTGIHRQLAKHYVGLDS